MLGELERVYGWVCYGCAVGTEISGLILCMCPSINAYEHEDGGDGLVTASALMIPPL